jgi:hypothetical protein
MMSEQKFPAGWDAERVKRLIDQQNQLSDEELAAEDDAAFQEQPGRTTLSVPTELLPAINQLLAAHERLTPRR